MSAVPRASFRHRLTLQTLLVAGVAVAGFGTCAWWFAMNQHERNHDLRIAQEARRLWTQLTPRHREDDFAQAVRTIFGEGDGGLAVVVVRHSEDHPWFSVAGPAFGETDRAAFLRHLPTGPEVVTEIPEADNPQRQGRAFAPGMSGVGTPRRPLMPEIGTPDFFTVETGGKRLAVRFLQQSPLHGLHGTLGG